MIPLRLPHGSLVVALLLTPSIVPAQGAPKAIAEVKEARLAQNAALATHQMDSAASFWANDVIITAGLGTVLRGKDAYRQAFASDSGMIYVRTPAHVEVARPWQSAWEDGEWVGRQGLSGPVVIRGRYAAQWHRVGPRWLIRSEIFVALACSGSACRWRLTSP
jgi:ketosteroid isomerase-like protein